VNVLAHAGPFFFPQISAGRCSADAFVTNILAAERAAEVYSTVVTFEE
jgi:hypothetical protein